MASTPGISILIRTRDSAKSLGELLPRLLPGPNDEIVVVDSGSSDGTVALAKAHGAQVVRGPGPFNYSRALNLGFAAARQPWVLVLSCHCIPLRSDFLEAHRRAAAALPEDVPVCYAPATLTGEAAFADAALRFRGPADLPAEERLCGNGNTLYRRAAWEAQRFDEGLLTAEDRRWLAGMAARGLRFAYNPAAPGINRYRGSLCYMFRKGYREIRAIPHRRQTMRELALGCGSLAKKWLLGPMRFDTFVRCLAHAWGSYLGSRRPQENAAPAGIRALFVTAGSWYLPKTAAAFLKRNALAALWMSDRNKGRFPKERFGWCWPFFWVTKPLHFTPLHGYWSEWIFWRALPAWRVWMRFRRYPEHNVVQARMGYAVEPFARAARTGALKVLDCANSHPETQSGHWQREIDRFAPGLKPILPASLFRRMEREVAAADLLLCPSDFVRDTFVERGVPEGKCFVCPFGYDPEIFTPRLEVPAAPRFLFTGTIGLRKGIPYLFRAFERVRRELPEAKLILIGEIHYDIAQELPRWDGLYTHLPGVPQPVLAEELRRATAYVFPSCEEGFARSLIEAMGCGIPVIASHESGATTFLRRSPSGAMGGVVVDPRDVEGIAEAMLRLARDPALNEAMGKEARRLVSGWTWQAYGDALLTRYRFLLGSPQGEPEVPAEASPRDTA